MPSLHDQTRRSLTLLIFLLFGPILTFGLVAGVAARKLPWNAQAFERSIATDTGLNLKIGAVEYRTPSVTRFQNVELVDESAATTLFYAPEIEYAFVPTKTPGDFFPGLDSKKEENTDHRPSLEALVSFFSSVLPFRSQTLGFQRLTIPNAEIRLDSLNPHESAGKTQELLLTFLSRYRKASKNPVQISLEHIGLRLRNDAKRERPLPTSLQFVQGNLYSVADTVRSDWTFKIPEVSEMETQRFSVEEQPSTKGSALVFRFSNSLSTNKNDYPKLIPCELAGAFCSFFHHFSKESSFFGDLTAEYRASETGNPWTFRLTDFYLKNLDVAPYAAEYTSFSVSGTANVQIIRAAFGNGIFTAEGWLEVQKGSMDRILFHRLVDRFALSVGPPGFLESSATVAAIPFDQCVVSFRFEKEGATFWKERSEYPNLFMARDSKDPNVPPMYVYLPDKKRPVSYLDILTAFAPDAAPIVPLTSGTQKIIGVLPTEKVGPKPVTAPPLPLTGLPQ